MALKAGTEDRKKVYILVGLLAAAGSVYLYNSLGSSESPVSSATTARGPSAAAPRAPGVQGSTAGRGTRTSDRALREFRPSLKPKKPEDRPDPTTIDPALRLDLLAKVQAVSVEGAHRNLFEFGAAPPPPKPEDVKAAKTKVPSPLVGAEAELAKTAALTPPKPTAPPVPLKFYGYVTPSGQPGKQAFFVEGEDIHVVNEGDVVKQRYKIVRIGINSVVVEDTQFGSQQTLPLEEQPG